jgi:uncharacterized membrane protein HdeD (DUF308 family)
MVTPFQRTGDRVGFGLVDLADVRAHRAGFIALGLTLLALGALAIALPFLAVAITTITLGWLLLLSGLAEGIHALYNRRWGGSGWALAEAALHVLAGFLVLAFPLLAKLTLTLVLSTFLALDGGLKVIRAIQHRALPAWGFLLADGIIAVALGFMVWINWPSAAMWALGLLIGADLVLNGSSLLLIGLGAERAGRAPL